MSKVLSELHFLPCVGVFQHYAKADEIVLEAQENYQKGSYRNRCHIIGANGLQRLSIPLASGKNNQLNIQQVLISDQQDWARQHWQSIRSAYGNAPFYFYYSDQLEQEIRAPGTNLWEYNLRLLQTIFSLLQWDKTISLSDTYGGALNAADTDIRNYYRPKAFQTEQTFSWPNYSQVFQERHGFVANLSILDLLFCLGPQANLYLSAEITSQ
ncbi:MAG: WbqC family protein [Bacteroidota bacterium]